MKRNLTKKWMTVVMLVLGSWTAAVAQNTQLNINQANGDWTLSNATKTWARQWTSKSTTPILTLTCAANNMAFTSDGNIKMYTGQAGVNFSSDYSLSVSAGYEIIDYSFSFTTDDPNKEIVITPQNGTPVSHKGTEAPAIVNVANIHWLQQPRSISNMLSKLQQDSL